MQRRVPFLFSAALLLAVWIATPLLSLAHVALEEHSYCAEHERLEEGSDSHASHEAERDADVGSRVSSPLPDDPEETHEGCAFGEDFTRETLYQDRPDYALSPPPSSDTGSTLFAQQREGGIPLLHVAPKSSPPTA